MTKIKKGNFIKESGKSFLDCVISKKDVISIALFFIPNIHFKS